VLAGLDCDKISHFSFLGLGQKPFNRLWHWKTTWGGELTYSANFPTGHVNVFGCACVW